MFALYFGEVKNLLPCADDREETIKISGIFLWQLIRCFERRMRWSEGASFESNEDGKIWSGAVPHGEVAHRRTPGTCCASTLSRYAFISWYNCATQSAASGLLLVAAQFLATWQLQVYTNLHYLHVTFNHFNTPRAACSQNSLRIIR